MVYKVFANMKFSHTTNPLINGAYISVNVNKADDAEQAIREAKAFLNHHHIEAGPITSVEMIGVDK